VLSCVQEDDWATKRGTSSGYPPWTAGSKTNFQTWRPRLPYNLGLNCFLHYFKIIFAKTFAEVSIGYQGSETQYAKISDKIAISGGFFDNFIEIYAIIAVRQFDYKR
jgi:hypothetical protein